MGLFSRLYKGMDRRHTEQQRLETEYWLRRISDAYKSGYREAKEQFKASLSSDVKRMCEEMKQKTYMHFNSQVVERDLGMPYQFDKYELDPVLTAPLKASIVQFRRMGFMIDISPQKEFMHTLRGPIKPKVSADE